VIEARQELLDAAPWLHVWAEDVRLPDDRLIEGYIRLEMLDYVVVVALADSGAIVLRSYKHGPADIVTSLPAGYLEPTRSPRMQPAAATGGNGTRFRTVGRTRNLRRRRQ
jgi:ADP-ribose pyrophosphatase